MWIGRPISLAAASAAAIEVEVVLDALDRRHEDAEPAVARLDRERGADGAAGFAELLLDALLLERCRRR